MELSFDRWESGRLMAEQEWQHTNSRGSSSTTAHLNCLERKHETNRRADPRAWVRTRIWTGFLTQVSARTSLSNTSGWARVGISHSGYKACHRLPVPDSWALEHIALPAESTCQLVCLQHHTRAVTLLLDPGVACVQQYTGVLFSLALGGSPFRKLAWWSPFRGP